MATELPSQNPDQKLAAFADGELEGEQYLHVLRDLAQEPALADRIAQHKWLRHAVGRAMDGPSFRAPTSLRERLVQMSREVAGEEQE